MSGASDPKRLLRERVDFVLVNVPPFDAIAGHTPFPDLDLRLAELTACFTMAAFDLQLQELSFADSHDTALARGNRDFCLIQKFGHIFQGPDDVATALLQATDTCAFLMGHIMERGGYYYLHDQCVLVNRRAWERLGRPAFGKPADGRKTVAVPRRSTADVHDDYTPLFLDPTGRETEQDAAYGYGWNAISQSLKAGIQVANWADAPRRWKHYCYAYYGDPAEWQRALGDVTQSLHTNDSGLRGIVDFLKQAANEIPNKIVALPGTALPFDIPAIRFNGGLDCLFAPARGFSANLILNAVGIHDAARIVHYDHNEAALTLKRRLIARWDGEDFKAFAGPEYPIAFHHDLGFESKDSWLRHWQRFKRLRHEFIRLDPLAEPDAMVAAVQTNTANAVMVAVDDCFDDSSALIRFDWHRRKAAYDSLIGALKANAELYVVVGTPPRRRIRG